MITKVKLVDRYCLHTRYKTGYKRTSDASISLYHVFDGFFPMSRERVKCSLWNLEKVHRKMPLIYPDISPMHEY